jgi:hypothetical protein
VVGEQSLAQDVQSPHPEGHHSPHDVHEEQRGFLKQRQFTFRALQFCTFQNKKIVDEYLQRKI